MKQILFTGMAIFMLVTVGFSQRKIEVNETSFGFSTGNQHALYVTVFESSSKDVSKAWQKKLKDFKGKINEKKGEISSDNALIKDFKDNNAVDIYTRFEDTKDGNTKMYVAINMGGAYLSSSDHPDKFKVMKKILYEFAKKMSEEVVNKQIKNASKILAGFESEQKNLEKENERLHKDIENYKEKIKKAEDDIKKNLADQEAKKKELEVQQKAVDALQEKLKGIK